MTEAERIAARTTPCPVCRRKLKARRAFDPTGNGRVRLPSHHYSEFGDEWCTGSGYLVVPVAEPARRRKA